MLTLVHVAFGSAALLTGAAALSVRKGGRFHAKAGTIFFAAMLVMAGTGAMVAASIGQRDAEDAKRLGDAFSSQLGGQGFGLSLAKPIAVTCEAKP